MNEQQTSSSDPLRVDTDVMRLAIARLHDLAGRLTSAGDKLISASESYGKPWGDDKTGDQFYGQYKDPHQKAVDAAIQAGKVLHDSTQQISDMVKKFESSEEQAAATGRSVRSVVDPG
jgi:uncharacterized protein YukE